MTSFSIESNGRIEKTALYLNGEQLAGVREVFLNMDEDGTFDAIIQYQGADERLYSKHIFLDHLENLKTREAAFTEYESQQLQLLTLESSGDIEGTTILVNDQPLEGITSLLVHIKSPQKESSGGLASLFTTKKAIPDHEEFKAEITFRNEDNTLSTEQIF